MAFFNPRLHVAIVYLALLDLLPPLMGDSNVLMKDHKAFLVATEVRSTRTTRGILASARKLN
jgi:hypothetical protein